MSDPHPFEGLKRLQKQLLEAQEKFKIISENSTDLICILDSKLLYTYVSPSVKDVLGYTVEELLHKSPFQLFVPEDIENRTKQNGVPNRIQDSGRYHYQIEKKDGQKIWLETIFKPIEGEPQRRPQLLTTSRDITKRKQATEELLSSERILRNIHKITTAHNRDFYEKVNELLQLGCQELKLDLGILSEIENSNYLVKCVFDPSEKIKADDHHKLGETLCDITLSSKPKYWPIFFEDITKSIWKNHPAYSYTKLKSYIGIPVLVNGEVHGTLNFTSLNARTKKISKTDREAIKLMAQWIGSGIESQQAQEIIRDSDVWLEEIINASRDGIIIELNDKIHYVNNAALELFGYKKPKDLLGKNSIVLIDKNQRPRIEELGRSRLMGKKVPPIYDVMGIRKDKLTFVMEVSAKLAKLKGQQFIISIIRDITQRKRDEKRLTSQNQELIKINAELDRFVYSASHDLRAPLASILGLINLIKLEKDVEKMRELLNMVTKSVDKMNLFIDDIIQYSRNSRLEPGSEKINFQELVSSVIEGLKYIGHAHEVSVNLTVDQKTPFYSDHNRLKVILNNLLSNAFNYYNPHINNPFIKINIKSNEQNALISIEDNGLGISKEHHPKIFDMFYRASEHRTGSGLGLYIVKESINTLNGSITMLSEIGKGTAFKVIIPQSVK